MSTTLDSPISVSRYSRTRSIECISNCMSVSMNVQSFISDWTNESSSISNSSSSSSLSSQSFGSICVSPSVSYGSLLINVSWSNSSSYISCSSSALDLVKSSSSDERSEISKSRSSRSYSIVTQNTVLESGTCHPGVAGSFTSSITGASSCYPETAQNYEVHSESGTRTCHYGLFFLLALALISSRIYYLQISLSF